MTAFASWLQECIEWHGGHVKSGIVKQNELDEFSRTWNVPDKVNTLKSDVILKTVSCFDAPVYHMLKFLT